VVAEGSREDAAPGVRPGELRDSDHCTGYIGAAIRENAGERFGFHPQAPQGLYG
jgi:hypothetical protein